MQSLKLDFENISYGTNCPIILSSGSIKLNQGDIALLLGKNGSGKTTLLLSMCGAIKCLSRFRNALFNGELIVKDSVIKPINVNAYKNFWHNSAVLFQYPDHNLATTNVLDELLLSAKVANLDARAAFSIISELIKYYDIDNILHYNIDMLSDGTKQLVALISSFLRNPSYMFFDEPTAMLDTSNKNKFITALEKYRIEHPDNITVIATHEPQTFSQLKPNRIFVIKDTLIKEYQSIDEAKDAFFPSQIEKEIVYNNSSATNILTADLLGAYYSKSTEPIFSGLNISINEGEFVTVTGSNGVGKTTLLRALSRAHKKYRGRLIFRGRNYRKEPPKRPKELSYIPQVPTLQFSEDTVQKELMFVHRNNDAALDNVKDIVTKSLEAFNIERTQDPLALSYGQQKVVSFLSFLNYPDLLLIDEPVICLDWTQQSSIFNILRNYSQNGTTLIVATHSPELFSKIETQNIQL